MKLQELEHDIIACYEKGWLTPKSDSYLTRRAGQPWEGCAVTAAYVYHNGIPYSKHPISDVVDFVRDHYEMDFGSRNIFINAFDGVYGGEPDNPVAELGRRLRARFIQG